MADSWMGSVKRSTSESLGVDQEGASLRSANQQQEPEPARPTYALSDWLRESLEDASRRTAALPKWAVDLDRAMERATTGPAKEPEHLDTTFWKKASAEQWSAYMRELNPVDEEGGL